MIPLCACPIGASYAPANVKLQEGRGREVTPSYARGKAGKEKWQT